MIKEFDIVKMPFDEIGIVREIKNILWGHKFVCEIIKTKGIFNQLGDLVDTKEEQLEVIELK